MIKVKDLSKTYLQGKTEIHAVKDVNLSVEKGETVAIAGPSGSGKTTLLSLLAGLERPDQGSISIDAQDIVKMSEEQLSQFRGTHVGIIFQQFHLMPHLTALENVSLPLEINSQKNAKDKALQALEEVGLKERASHLPSQLSGGERQRVAIARAIVVEPKILFADEPSGNLDTSTGEKVTALLFNLVKAHKMTMILVTHDMKLANQCDRQATIEGGQFH